MNGKAWYVSRAFKSYVKISLVAMREFNEKRKAPFYSEALPYIYF
jgi:hypothetical protein